MKFIANTKPTLTITQGLPGSGKTTWACEQVKASGGKIKRINKDELRAMVDGGRWGFSNERQIIKVRNILIEHWLNNGFSVIVDDTNLTAKHEKTMARIAYNCQADFKVHSFLDIPPKECTKRYMNRSGNAGERIVMNIINKLFKDSNYA